MTRLEVKKLVDLITIHRPYFTSRLGDKILNELMSEWERIMGPYDYEDIKDNLEKFLKDENNYGREPDAYQLIRGLFTIEDKNTNSLGRVTCQFCGRVFNRLEVYEHEDRCRSIKYLKKLYRNYLLRELEDIQALYSMKNEDFDKAYIRVLEIVLPKVTNRIEKHGIENVIETYYGRPAKYGIEDFK